MITEWTCMICFDTRPDAKISVVNKRVELAPRVPAQLNVKYCNDRQRCTTLAAKVRRIEDLPKKPSRHA